MQKILIAALASLMLAGVIAGASESTVRVSSTTVLMLGEGSSPVPVDFPSSSGFGDVASRQQ